jgi:hypothetical protein
MNGKSYAKIVACLMGAVLVTLPAMAQDDIDVCFDHATGGGWIVGTPSGASANFGVGGGQLPDGTLWGHLNYVDQDADLHVVATAVTSYAVDPNDGNCRLISYEVTINGESGFTADVRVCDYGEPGAEDTFQITLSNGYSASGDLADDAPGGGNIQLHLIEDCQ